MNFDIGGKLKSLRGEKALSIKELSNKSGVSTGQISQIEKGKVVPTVSCLWKLAISLGVSINCFFEEEKSQCTVLRKGDRRVITLNRSADEYELLSPTDKNHLIDFVMVRLKPNEMQSEKVGISHDGEECGYVLKGTLTVLLDGESIELNEGDSIYFESTRPHCYMNLHHEECISLWAMTPLFF